MVKDAPRLLVVDDEQDTCANLSDIFTDLGYQVDIAYDGTAVLRLVERHTYDLALLDLKMPGMNGLELYERIRQISAGTVAIVVTAYASSDTAVSVLKAGAWKILSKPVDLPQLLTVVEQALHQPLVLIVDDDRDLCDSLWDVFRERGYRVSLAHDIPEAAETLRRHDFQIVLIDMRLPAGNGSEVLACMRAANPEARSIMITGYRDELQQLVQQALANGANAVCYKPFAMDHLLATVRQLTD